MMAWNPVHFDDSSSSRGYTGAFSRSATISSLKGDNVVTAGCNLGKEQGIPRGSLNAKRRGDRGPSSLTRQSKIVQDPARHPAVESILAEHLDTRAGTGDCKTTEKILIYPCSRRHANAWSKLEFQLVEGYYGSRTAQTIYLSR